MKKILIIFLINIPLLSISQITLNLSGVTNKKISSDIQQGTNVSLIEIKKENEYYKAIIKADTLTKSISIRDLDNIVFSPNNTKEFWQHQALRANVYSNMAKNGFQYLLRQELADDAIEYFNYVYKNNILFEDSYLESYLHSIAYSIYPSNLEDGRPGILKIKILKDIAPNSFVFPNGTMYITTGLLSTLNSEEELIGIFAHEIAHYVLEHSITNINKVIQRRQRAEFWAGVATGLALVADVYVASTSEYYSPGALTMGTAIIAYSIAESINERMGLKYTSEQEYIADKCAVNLMESIGINPSALASAYTKIKNNCMSSGNYLMLTSLGTYFEIDNRINIIGKPTPFFNINYEKRISFATTFNAIMELNNQRFEACIKLTNRNINANIATEEDYILKAMCITNLYYNEAKNIEALELLNTAKSLNIYPTINLIKQEAIILIRLGKTNDAINSLQQYKSELEKESLNLEKTINNNEWSNLNSYIQKEYEWTQKMINKAQALGN